MHLTVRKRLILFIVLPVSLIFCGVGTVMLLGLHHRLEARARTDAESLATHYARELDSRFVAVTQIAQSTAAVVETNPDISEQQMYEMLRRNVTQHPLVFGAAIAFQPHRYRPDRRLFSPYVCRDGKGGVRQFDLSDSYDYDQPEQEWWWQARELGEPRWSAPYIDEGASNVVMSTYSVPFRQSGEFWGVATIDIALTTLEDVVGLDELHGDTFAIVDRDGRFVAHPDPEKILSESLYLIAKRFDAPQLAEIARRMHDGETGVARLPDWRDRQGKIWLYFAPIPSTGWTFAAVISESEALAFLRTRTIQLVGLLSAALVLIVLAVVLVSKSLTSPIKQLRSAVQVIAGGNLDAEPIPIRSHDEIGELGASFNQMLADLKDHVTRLADEQAARRAVEGELEAARHIQQTLIPSTFPPFPERDDIDLHAILNPAKSVAGDFYDFFFVDDHTLVFLIADVSGKGIPAALFMAVARTLLRNLATVTHDPKEIFEGCGRMLVEDNPGTMFVTTFLGVYDLRTGEVRYANAGHPPPYRLDAQNRISEFGTTTGTILGLIPDAEYSTKVERLEPGDRLVLFTDGVTEAEAPDGSMLDPEGLETMLADIGGGDAKTLCEEVCRRVAVFEQGAQNDDVTVLVLGRPL